MTTSLRVADHSGAITKSYACRAALSAPKQPYSGVKRVTHSAMRAGHSCRVVAGVAICL